MSFPTDVCARRDDAISWRVYDWKAKSLRRDVHAVDSATMMMIYIHHLTRDSVGCPFCAPLGYGLAIEQRERILVVPALRWIALDVPLDANDEALSELKVVCRGFDLRELERN